MLEQRKIFYLYAQFGFKLKQRGIKLLYLVIRGYNFTSEFFFLKQRISQVDNLEVIFLKEKRPKKIKMVISS